MRAQSASTPGAWLMVAALSIVSAGAYIGNEAAQYFWDLREYVEALDSEFPYRYADPYPFLYPPVAKHIFTMARTHLFELLSIAHVAAAAIFLNAFARLPAPRKYEWLFAITATGGLGVVSLMSGNVAIPMNLTVLGVTLRAATGDRLSLALLPLVIGAGALIKPQFIVYLGLLPFLERRLSTAIVKGAATILAVAAIHGVYTQIRAVDWAEYATAAYQRTVVEKDFAWGPAGFTKRFSDDNAVAFASFAGGLIIVGALAFAAWRRSSAQMAKPATICLVFLTLTFANPRMPPYDVFIALLALGTCCAMVGGPLLTRVLAALLAINLVPWVIEEFTRAPGTWPSWMQSTQVGHLLTIVALLVALSRTSLVPQGGDRIDA